jgi:hypothetical protein
MSRATLCVQRQTLPYAYVAVEGPVALASATRDTRVAIAVRYLGEEAGTAYVDTSGDDDLLVTIHPERWWSVDFA